MYSLNNSIILIVAPEIAAVFSFNPISAQGEIVILTCLTVGIYIDSYEWVKDRRIVGNNQTLEVIVNATSGGIYTCTVSNAAGTDSASTTLYVEPFINTPLNDQTLTTNGSSININCDVAGFLTPNISWVNGLGLEVSNSSQLQLNPVTFGDEGLYTCVLTTEIVGINFSAMDETTLFGNNNYYQCAHLPSLQHIMHLATFFSFNSFSGSQCCCFTIKHHFQAGRYCYTGLYFNGWPKQHIPVGKEWD